MNSSAKLLVSGFVLNTLGSLVMALGGLFPPDADDDEGVLATLGSLFVFGFLLAAAGFVVLVVGVYRLASNVDETLDLTRSLHRGQVGVQPRAGRYSALADLAAEKAQGRGDRPLG